jgi:hypothetical protein
MLPETAPVMVQVLQMAMASALVPEFQYSQYRLLVLVIPQCLCR